MKSLTTNVAHVRIVEIISDQWISQMLHMNADLVCASGLKLQWRPDCNVWSFLQHDNG